MGATIKDEDGNLISIGIPCAFCHGFSDELRFKLDAAGTPYAVCPRCCSAYRLADWRDISEEQFYTMS